MRHLGEMLPTPSVSHLEKASGQPIIQLGDSERITVKSTLNSLLGLSQDEIQDSAPAEWPHQVSPFSTTTGLWSGYARELDSHITQYCPPCLLLQFDERKRVAAVAVLPRVVVLDRGGTVVSEPIALVGRAQIGEAESWRANVVYLNSRPCQTARKVPLRQR
jgi:hypothetical protein